MTHKPKFVQIVSVAFFLFFLGACRQPALNNALNTLNFSISKKNIVFRAGTSFGFCVGYCATEMEINGTELHFKEFASARILAPDRFYADTIAVDEWNALVEAFDWQKFAELDSVIGCPDCADGGAEWLEIDYFGQTKKVTFEFGAALDGLDGFLTKIREHRKNVQDRIRNGNKFPQITLTNQAADSLHHSAFSIDSASIEGDVLRVDLSHSGGCREHFYSLFMSPAAFKESFPVQADLYLRHQDNDDPCDAIISQTRAFDLRPIAEAYQQSYGRLDTIVLHLHWRANRGEVQSIRLEYQPQ